MRELLRHRDFRLLLLGQTLSMFGDTALFLALAVWARELTGSASAGGLVFLALALPALGGPVYGLWVDRLPRRRLMIAVDLSTAAAVLLLLAVRGVGQLWLLYGVAVVYGASLALFQSARSALVQSMLPPSLLGNGNAALTTVREGLRLVGPLVGAALFVTLGGGATAVLDALTFVVSAGCLALVRTAEPPPPQRQRGTRRDVRGELAAGARHIVADPVLRRVVGVLLVAWGVVGFTESTVFLVVSDGLGRPPGFLGVLSFVQGLGAVAGGLSSAQLGRRLGEPGLVGLGLAGAGLGSVLSAGNGFVPVLAGIALFGAALPWVAVGLVTVLQRRTPAALQGRTYSAADTALTVPQTVSIAVGAALVAIVDYRLVLLAMALVLVGCAAGLLGPARLSRLRRPRTGAARPGSP
jgi:MFS family permease